MFRHNQMRKALACYASLSKDEQAIVDNHVQSCQECFQRQQSYQSMDAALSTLTSPTLSPGFRARFLAQIYAREAREQSPIPRTSYVILGRSVALAGIAIFLFWVILYWIGGGATPEPGKTASSPEPLPYSGLIAASPQTDDVLQEVPFRFDMTWCNYSPYEWNRDGILDLQVDRVLISLQDWDNHQRWRIEGRYRSRAGEFQLSIAPDFSPENYVSFITTGDSVLPEGEGDFALEGHISQGKAAPPTSFTLLIMDREANTQNVVASCPIRLDVSHSPTPAPHPTPSDMNGWRRDFAKQERERALRYAPAVRDWIAQRTWFTLPATIPWEYHQPMRNAFGTPQMGQVTFVYLADRLVPVQEERRLTIYWRQGMPSDWEQTRQFPIEFVQAITQRSLPRSFSGDFVWEGEGRIDGWTFKQWRRSLLGRADERWVLWYDGNADLTYALSMDYRDENVFHALLQDFHAKNPDEVSAVQRAVISWTEPSLTWVPPWLTQDMTDLSFQFDLTQCVNSNDSAALPIELNLTRVAVSDARDGVLRWLVEGEYHLPGDGMQAVLSFYPADDALGRGGMLASLRTSVIRTGIGLLSEYHSFAMLTEMKPPDDGTLPQRMTLAIQISPDQPGWQCPVDISSQSAK